MPSLSSSVLTRQNKTLDYYKLVPSLHWTSLHECQQPLALTKPNQETHSHLTELDSQFRLRPISSKTSKAAQMAPLKVWWPLVLPSMVQQSLHIVCHCPFHISWWSWFGPRIRNLTGTHLQEMCGRQGFHPLVEERLDYQPLKEVFQIALPWKQEPERSDNLFPAEVPLFLVALLLHNQVGCSEPCRSLWSFWNPRKKSLKCVASQPEQLRLVWRGGA